ncbi:hypothetical protein D3C71_1381230 [compost metagenome]
MLWASRVTWRRTNTDIVLFDQFFIAQSLIGFIAPELFTDTLMQMLRKCLGKTIR